MSRCTNIDDGALLSWSTNNSLLIWEDNDSCLNTRHVQPALEISANAGDTTGTVVATCDQEFLGICFIRPTIEQNASIFGFAEFGAALALLVIVYTISDIRYRFRIAVAPIPLLGLTYILLVVIGLTSLLSDIWFGLRWPLPEFLQSQLLWQGALGLIFLVLILTWLYYGFIAPSKFNSYNYSRFTRELYRLIVKGSDSDLPIIAGELARSASAIVKFSKPIPQVPFDSGESNDNQREHRPGAPDFAYEVLLLIGNRKLCRHIVASSPGTAIAFFDAMGTHKKYHVPLRQFARNVSAEALINKDSILYHEDEGYYSGLIGYVQPFSKAIYGNYSLVEALAHNNGSPLDINYQLVSSWDASQLEAYSRAVMITLENYFSSGHSRQNSYALKQAVDNIEHSCMDVYKLNEISSDFYSTDIYKRLSGCVDFVRRVIDYIDKQENLPKTRLRLPTNGNYGTETFYDHIAGLMFEIIDSASSVTAPQDKCWSIQHNAVWGDFFGLSSDKQAGKIIRFKLRRLLYDEIRRLEKFPNYKSSHILGFCLNVMGLKLGNKEGYDSGCYALKKAVLSWTKTNFLALRNAQPEVAGSCLLGSISFDEENSRLVNTFAKFLSLEAPKEYLELENVREPSKE